MSVSIFLPGRERPAPPRAVLGTVAIVGVAALSVGVFLATQLLVPALAVPIVAMLIYAVGRLPLRYTVLAFVTFFVMSDIGVRPLDRTTSTYWLSPLFIPHYILTENLSKTTGIDALRFSGAEVILVGLLGIIAARWMAGSRIDARGRQPDARVMFVFLACAFAGVLCAEAWGIVRGGDVRQSLWQFRALLWLPVLGGLFGYCLRDLRDVRLMAIGLTIAACVKIAMGAYYLLVVARAAGYSPDFMTTHDDSVLFVAVMMMWFARWAHTPRASTFIPLVLVGAVVMTGLVLNNRRIAFVGLLASLFLLFVLFHGRLKRLLIRSVVYALPLIVIYLFAGRHRSTGIFKPASLVMSVTQQKDASSKTRDIENYNLIQTIKPNKLLGSGWGHEYVEVNKAYDIAEVFAQYRYVAHNSVLWLLSIGGMVFFSVMWMPICVTILLAARSYRWAVTAEERTVAAGILGVMMTYVIQAWGDMGTQGMSTCLIVAMAMAASAKLAHQTGAWPAQQRLFGQPKAVRRAAVLSIAPESETF
jgi:O-Antigen ligase